MRKTTIAAIVVVGAIAAGAYVYYAKPFRPDIRTVEKLSQKWMEDLQFKDFRSSSLYHHELDRNRVDIGRTIERLFVVPPETLDIMDYRIVESEVDSSGKRARVRVKTRYKRLNKDKEPQEGDLMLYWAERHPDCPIGASCEAGTCVDEFGKPVHETDGGDDTDHGHPSEAAEPAEAEGETFSCDTAAERQWYMNLDSTLKEKAYQRE